jgi:hypothetical protein
MPLDENMKQAIERTKDYWSTQGKRVILLARKVLFKDNIHSQPTSSQFESEAIDYARSGLNYRLHSNMLISISAGYVRRFRLEI